MLELIQYRNACPPAVEYKRKTIDKEQLDKLNALIEAATNYVEAQRLNLTADMSRLSDKLFAAVKELQDA